jgi:hypothetical protein
MGVLQTLNKARGHSRLNHLSALAETANPFTLLSATPRKPPKVYHPMVTAPDGEIQLWNETVTTRQVLRARIKPWRSMQGRLMWENRS